MAASAGLDLGGGVVRILLLSHYYWPEVGAPQRRWSTMVSHLVAKGHEIVVAAPHPHYPYTCRDEFFGSGVGRRRARVRASLAGSWDTGEFGERVIRVPYLRGGASMARQILDQAVAAFGAVSTSLRTMRGANRPDVIISTTPGLPTLLAGDFLSRVLGVPHVAEVRDAWPDLIHELSLVSAAGGRLLPSRIAGALERSVLPNVLTRAQQRAQAVVVTTSAFQKQLLQRGIKAEVVRSGVSRSEAEASTHSSKGSHSGFHLLYVGTVGRSQDLSCAIEASVRVPGLTLRIVGHGADKPALERLAERLHAPVEFYDQAIGAALVDHWSWADAGLVSLGDVPAHLRTVPSKLYSLMVRKVPVLGIVDGEAAAIIEQNQAGITARPGDVGSIAEAMKDMSEQTAGTGENARRWVLENASAEVMGKQYEAIIERAGR